MNFTRIESPKYLVSGEYLNEYEVRQLQIDIRDGKFEPGIQVEENGIIYTIGSGGRFVDGVPKGFSLSYELVKQLL
jgi:hypothetical protein